MSKWEDDFNKRPARSAFKWGVLALGVVFGLTVVSGGLMIITSPFRSAAGIVERTTNPDNVLANYEWFKRQYQDVKAFDVKLDNANAELARFKAEAGPRDKWTFEDKQESARLGSIVLGLQNQKASMVAEYNARTQMANRNIFRTGDLPDHL